MESDKRLYSAAPTESNQMAYQTLRSLPCPCISFAFAFLVSVQPAATAGELLLDGDFDSLVLGSTPDDNESAGAWHFAQENIDTGSSEGSFTGVFTVEQASDVVPGDVGDILDVSGAVPSNIHLSNVLQEQVTTDFVIRFDTYIPSDGGGGAVYLAGNEDGPGSLPSERGPQVGFFKDGTVRGRSSSVVIGAYEFDRWLTFEIHGSVADQRFSVYAGDAGEPLMSLGSGFEFRGDQVESFDRLSGAHFSVLSPVTQYFDNFSVQAVPEPEPGALVLSVCAALVGGGSIASARSRVR